MVTLTLNLMSQLLLLVIVSGILFSINARLALIALAIAPFIVAAALSFRYVARITTQQARRVLAEVNAKVQETITGISVAKSFRQEGTIYREFSDVNTRSYDLNLRQGMVFSAIFPILGTIAGIGSAVVVYAGGVNVVRGAVTPGEWFLFVESYRPVLVSTDQHRLVLEPAPAGAVGQRAGVRPDRRRSAGQTGRPAPGDAALGPHRVPAARLSLHRSGAGARGLRPDYSRRRDAGPRRSHRGGQVEPRQADRPLLRVPRGQLLIDGQDIRSFDLGSYRRRFGIVQQTPFLFSGTVRDNIRYGNPEAAAEAVRFGLHRLGGGDWLEALPGGLETEVGEEGKQISMGQRQLVSLAQVLLKDPAIVILDEATASVDPLTEAQIQEGLDVVLRSRTAIVIAHRLSTIKSADRIVVLRRGEIVEAGDHDMLLEARRALRRALQHLLPAPGARLRP